MLDVDLDAYNALLIAALAMAIVMEAARRVNWRGAAIDEHNRWAIATATVFIGHQMTAMLPAGIALHYLGGAALALVLGYPRAILSMALILTLDNLMLEHPGSLGLRLLLDGVLPVLAMTLIVTFARRHLPPNLFVFLLGCGFFGLFAVYALQQAVGLTLRQWLDPIAPLASEGFLGYALLLAGGEATLEGMVITILVVYLPGSVRLFDEGFYLRAVTDDR